MDNANSTDDAKPSRQSDGAQQPENAGPIQPAIRVMLMPKDTNGMGTIFGGIILSYIDLAGAIEARRFCRGAVVTVAMEKVEFHAPVFVGDLVSFYTETLRVGNTSVTTKVLVEVERREGTGTIERVTEAEVIYVHVDEEREPMSLDHQRVRAAGFEPKSE